MTAKPESNHHKGVEPAPNTRVETHPVEQPVTHPVVTAKDNPITTPAETTGGSVDLCAFTSSQPGNFRDLKDHNLAIASMKDYSSADKLLGTMAFNDAGFSASSPSAIEMFRKDAKRATEYTGPGGEVRPESRQLAFNNARPLEFNGEPLALGGAVPQLNFDNKKQLATSGAALVG